MCTPLTHYALHAERSERRNATLPTPAVALLPRALRFALQAQILSRFAPSDFALRARCLPYDTHRVPRSVHAKFHRIKTMDARGIQTYRHSPLVTVALS